MSTFPKKNYESPLTVEIEIKTGKPLLNNSQYSLLLLGYFWPSSIVPKEDANEAWSMLLSPGERKYMSIDYRYLGYSVRPVFPK